MLDIILNILAFAQSANNGAAFTFELLYMLFFIIIIAISFIPGLQQQYQMMFMSKDVEKNLNIIENYLKDAKSIAEKLLKEKNFQDPKAFL
ncbi:MAG: DUF1512 family protein, partial [Acidianus infernus]|nr:DUF1512 family protein [Acidianus infernus]